MNQQWPFCIRGQKLKRTTGSAFPTIEARLNQGLVAVFFCEITCHSGTPYDYYESTKVPCLVRTTILRHVIFAMPQFRLDHDAIDRKVVMSPPVHWHKMRSAECSERCPSSRVKRKTSSHSEYFAFRRTTDIARGRPSP
jgi:hypothetical protein